MMKQRSILLHFLNVPRNDYADIMMCSKSWLKYYQKYTVLVPPRKQI